MVLAAATMLSSAGHVSAQLRVAIDGVPNQLMRSTRAERVALSNSKAEDVRVRAGKLQQRLLDLGYAEARVSTDYLTTDSAHIRVQTGPYYALDSLLIEGGSAVMVSKVALPQRRRRHVAYSATEVANRLSPALDYAGAQGYIQATSETVNQRYRLSGDTVHVTATYRLSLGPRVLLDRVVLANADAARPIREKERFVAALLRLKVGQVLNPQDLTSLPALLDASPYYASAGPPQLSIDSSRATITVPMRVNRANKFDAVLGALPPRAGQPDWQFTGLVDLALVSPLGRGEILQLNYQELPLNSRRIDARLKLPALAGTPLDAQVALNLFKQDSSFQTVAFDASLDYRFSSAVQVRISTSTRTSNLLSIAAYRGQIQPLPPSLDGRSSSVGLGLTYDRLDYAFNPIRGLRVSASASIGTKSIRRSRGLDSLDLSGLKQSLPRREWRLDVLGFIKTAKKQTLHLALHSYWLDQAERFDNDLAFLGGARSLRGFNEQQFLASFYTVGTIEYRLLIDRDSYVGAFADVAYVERATVGGYEKITPRGFGVNLQVATRAGVLSVAYAVGQVEGQSIQAGRGRIHLGYISRF